VLLQLAPLQPVAQVQVQAQPGQVLVPAQAQVQQAL